MEWSGKELFGSQDLRNWTIDGVTAGKTRSAKGLTFATIYGAGHLVCGFTIIKGHLVGFLTCVPP